MSTKQDTREAKEILKMIDRSESEKDALAILKRSGYSEEESEQILDAALELLYLVN